MGNLVRINYFGVRCHFIAPDYEREPKSMESPVLIDGVTEFETLCPVSKLTGHRSNPLTLLRMALSDKNSRLLDSILQELPSVQEVNACDEDKLSLLVSRLDTGSFAENDVLTHELSKVVDVLFPKQPELKQQAEQGIEFKAADVPDGAISDNP